ncbi:aryl-sulfate sulfotransferase N-terminal domain-containing protein, partial [Escherichia coli]
MNTLTTTSVVLPAPRPAINQGIDINNEMVLNHTAIYENCLAQVTQENTVENALMLLDPYGTAPLSAYAGVWSLEPAEIIVTVQDAAKTAMPVEH